MFTIKKSFKKINLVCVFSLLLGASSCSTKTIKDGADNSSKTADAEISSSDLKSKFGAKSEMLSGFHLILKPQQDSQSCLLIEREEALTDQLKLTLKIALDCNYVIKLEIGNFDPNLKKLSKTYLTNKLPADTDQVVTYASLVINPKVSVVVRLTDEAKKDGFSDIGSPIESSSPNKPINNLAKMDETTLTNGLDLTATVYNGFKTGLYLAGALKPGAFGQENIKTPICVAIYFDKDIDVSSAVLLSQKIRVEEGYRWYMNNTDSGAGDTHELLYEIKNGRMVYFLKDQGKYLSGIAVYSIDSTLNLAQALNSSALKVNKIQYNVGCNI